MDPVYGKSQLSLSTHLQNPDTHVKPLDFDAHYRWSILDHVYLGGFFRREEFLYFSRSSIGPSIKAYFYSWGPFRMSFSQTFALAWDRQLPHSHLGIREKEWFQSISRLGYEFDVAKEVSLGMDLSNQSDNRNGGNVYEIRGHLNFSWENSSQPLVAHSPVPNTKGLSIDDHTRFGSKSIVV